MLVKEVEYYKNSNAINSPGKRSRDNEADKRKYDELRKAKKNREKRKKELSKYKRKVIFQVIAVAFIACIASLALDAKVFRAQNDLTKVNKEIAAVNSQNEDLKVSLIHTGSLSDIETNAQNKLGMMQTTKSNIVAVDLSANYFQKLDDEEKAQSEIKPTFMDKIKGIIN